MARTQQTHPTGTRGREVRIAEFVRFAIVGGSSTAIFMATYTGCILAGLPYGLAQGVGWGVSVLWGFALHHRFTFQTGRSGLPSRDAGIGRWLALQVTVMGLNLGGLALLIGWGCAEILAQLLLLPFIPLISYGLSRRYVFAGEEASEQDLRDRP